MRFWLPWIVFISLSISGFGQDSARSKLSNRRWMVGGATVAAYTGSFIVLNSAWYKDYPRSAFHTYDDSGEWLQMDKAGHVWTAYALSKGATGLWKWAGFNNNQAVLGGSATSLAYMLSIEYLDGRSAQWGWSWADVAADFAGAGIFAAQELAWKKQIFSVRFSSFPKKYLEPMLQRRADELYGKDFQNKLLKDYNAQTYWLSVNLKDLLPDLKVPAWFNIAAGYGADGMYGGYENLSRDAQGLIKFDRRDIPRVRQFYLGPDVDLSKIPVRSKFLKTLFFAAGVIKFPAPALMLDGGKLRFKALAF